jgi:hypothetical protein
MENLSIWNAVKQPPTGALRQIQAGRLKGKSDINPQWRYKTMTEQFGPCGVGWKFDIVKTWTEPGPDNQVISCAQINLYIKVDGQWSEPIPGVGGHMLVVKESAGLHANDEGFKMAITDALGTAMKMLGVGADVYAGLWDGTKYKDTEDKSSNPTVKAPPATNAAPGLLPGSNQWILETTKKANIEIVGFLKWINNNLHLPIEDTLEKSLQTWTDKNQITDDERQALVKVINAKLKGAADGQSK